MNMQYGLTITFGDCAENHRGMQVLGEQRLIGFDLSDLQAARLWFTQRGISCTLHELAYQNDKAHVLVAHQGLEAIVNVDEFHNEQLALEKDTKAKMYGRVVNKHARHNLCFADEPQEPDYEDGKGRVYAFEDVQKLNILRQTLPDIIGSKAHNLVAEGNYYYNVDKCGIGYHGDSERRIVVGIRTGASFPLIYRWYLHSARVGDAVKLNLNHGDMYFMSDKAVGHDWKTKSIPTLRHAAGCAKYTD